MSNSPSSTNPADYYGLTGTFRSILRKHLQGVNTMLPAEVVSFDRGTNRVSVQPLITILNTLGQQQPRARIASIPVFQLGGGGFTLNFNLVPGDLGWIIANDRDISLFLENYKQAPPNTFRIKDFADSVFFPHVMQGYTIDEEDATNAVLQNLDGTVKISLGTNKIKISAPNVEIDSASTVTVNSPSVNIIATGMVKLTTPLLRVEGAITASGTITPNVP